LIVGGPSALAFVSDSVLQDEAKVHLSLAIVSRIFLPPSAVILGLGLKARQAIDRSAAALLGLGAPPNGRQEVGS